MVAHQELEQIRATLAAADEALVAALEDRARAILRFVELRREHPDAYIALPPTAEVVRRALDRAEAFPARPLEEVVREVLGACANMVAPMRVAVLVPEGGFSHLAARKHFGSSAEIIAVQTIRDAFEEVARERVAFAVVPFETSTDGALSETLDCLMTGDATISGELTMACGYDLVSKTGNAADIEKVYAPGGALAACEGTLKEEFGRAALLDVLSGPVALELAIEDHGAAALVAGGLRAGDDDLRIVRESVEDRRGVETRFVIVGHKQRRKTSRDRTILSLALGDDPGSLHRALKPFAERSINLTRIESRPARGSSWRYVFIVELDGHISDRTVLTAVEEVRRDARNLKILGSYPKPTGA